MVVLHRRVQPVPMWRVLLPIGVAVVLALIGLREHHVLTCLHERNATTVGEVTSVSGGRVSSIRYRYTVDGQTYTGAGPYGPDMPPLQSLPGQPIVVYYLPERPQVSTIGDLEERIEAAGWIPMVILALGVTVSCVLYTRGRIFR